jgi:hypothetical protein
MRKFEFVKRMGENGLKLPERSTAKSARIWFCSTRESRNTTL